MSTAEPMMVPAKNGYPTSDGRPMAETDHHRELMFDLIKTLQARYADNPMIYVSGNLLVFYVRGDKRRHLSPDVFVVKGVPKRERLNYLVWQERKGPDVVIELTSSSTRREDTKKKFLLYQDELRVPEYFLFDPFGDYLDPPLQGYRLRQVAYVPIKPMQGRLVSKTLGLHLEAQDSNLRLFDPDTGQVLPTPQERVAEAERARQQAERARHRVARARQRAARAQQRAEQALQQAEQALQQAQRENERLRLALESLRQRPSEAP
jgi:Uma2 family endonuclease